MLLIVYGWTVFFMYITKKIFSKTMKSEILITFGNRVKMLREQNGLSQEEFAYRSGLDRSYISGVENGRRNISLKAIYSIAEALDITLMELFENI